MHDEMDPDIEKLFEEQNRGLVEEPFLHNTLHRLKKRQARQGLLHKSLWVLALACCALLSSFFIRSSVLLSEYVGIGLGYLNGFFEMPVGPILCGAFLLFFAKRKLIYVLVRP